jgi:GNAT superfamily N-acetyltransferase
MAHTRTEVQTWVAEVLIPAGGVHVATLDARVVAMLAVSRTDGVGWIDQMYVHPDHVGRGVGAQLLQTAHAVLASPIRLCTFQANAQARRFYERHGFQAIEFTDGANNQERCPDVVYEHLGLSRANPST